MKKKFFVLLVILFISTLSFSKCVLTAKVRYRANYGWSKYYTVDVIFISGNELNQATNSFDYDFYSVYAVIFWSQDEASVIKISTTLLCGYTVSCSCLDTPLSYKLEGEDQEGRKWEICLSDYFCY